MMAIGQLINLTSQGQASSKRINAMLEEDVEIKDPEDSVDHEIEGKITFNGFSFSYPNSDTLVLEDISFTLNKGESLGIVGRTGSGKTTLVDSLLRLYNLNENQVFIDDIDIMKIKLKSLRKAL